LPELDACYRLCGAPLFHESESLSVKIDPDDKTLRTNDGSHKEADIANTATNIKYVLAAGISRGMQPSDGSRLARRYVQPGRPILPQRNQPWQPTQPTRPICISDSPLGAARGLANATPEVGYRSFIGCIALRNGTPSRAGRQPRTIFCSSFNAVSASFEACSHSACVVHLLRIRSRGGIRLLLSRLLPSLVPPAKSADKASHRRSCSSSPAGVTGYGAANGT
jgi:hypothetical protein